MSDLSQSIVPFVKDIWSSMLGLGVERAAAPTGVSHASRSFTGCVQITGSWEGAVTLDCSANLAARLASVMFSLDGAPSSADIRDTIGELTNILGGNIKTVLPTPNQLCLPAVAEGSDYSLALPGSRLVCSVVLECEKEPIVVSIFEREK